MPKYHDGFGFISVGLPCGSAASQQVCGNGGRSVAPVSVVRMSDGEVDTEESDYVPAGFNGDESGPRDVPLPGRKF